MAYPLSSIVSSNMRRHHLAASSLLTVLAAAHAAHADNGVPTPSKVVIVIEENHGYSQIIGSSSAPYINSLAATGALFTQSYALTHPSQPNYVAFFSGSTQGVTTDGVYPHTQFTAPNLGAKLRASPRGFTFGGYSETMPSVGYDSASFGTAPATYQRKHNPWANWQDSTLPLPANKLPPAVNMPFAGYFPTDFSTLPTLSFVIPNQLHDMHDGTIAQGDTWLRDNLTAYAQWCQNNNGLLIVTFDEDDTASSNRVATIFHGPMVATGQYSETINHYRLLRTLEDMFGLPYSGGTVSTTPILDVWTSCAPTISAQPAPATTCPTGNASFSITAAGAGSLSYQWQLETTTNNWIDAVNGGLPYNGGTIIASGATTSQLQLALNALPGAPSLRFRCVATNACSSVSSTPAMLSICRADFNCDGEVNFFDYLDFVDAFSSASSLADSNRDGAIDFFDYLDFVDAFSSGC